MLSRRKFLARACAAGACTALVPQTHVAQAEPLGLPLGLQLYSVREQLTKDFDGTLDALGTLGYREVEAAGFYSKSPAEIKQAMARANLRCVSAHYPFANLEAHFDEILAFGQAIGLGYLICSSPGFRVPAQAQANVRPRTLSLDDWHYNADRFNAMGRKTAAAGIQFGYHNHIHEFTPVENTVPYLDLLRLTDPAIVTMELDCGWAVVGGFKPADLLRDHPGRFSMLHVKDFKADGGTGAEAHEPTVTELGRGSIDYRPIFAQAARTQKIKHMFIEQEAFDMPFLQSLKVDADYMRAIRS